MTRWTLNIVVAGVVGVIDLVGMSGVSGAVAPSTQAVEKTAAARFDHSKLQAVPFDAVHIDDTFWKPRIESMQRFAILDLLDLAEQQGKIENFRIAAGKSRARYRMYNAPDSDVYKLVEAACYGFVTDPAPALRQRIDQIVGLIAAAQQPDGYLNTQYTLPADHPSAPNPQSNNVKTFGFGKAWRWASTRDRWPFAYAQLYCAGHLMEAAAAHYRATGSRQLLDVAVRLAGCIEKRFPTEASVREYADHPEVEIGLMRLFEVTGDPRWVKLADLLGRNLRFDRPPDLGDGKNHALLADQREAWGHGVRTNYLYAGMTDVLRAAPAADLSAALSAIWTDEHDRKLYVIGGVGNGAPAEQHGDPFDLPNRSNYCESCSSVAVGQWNHALNLLSGESRFADFVELVAFNNALAAVSFEGNKFFYANPINVGSDNRKDEHSGVRRRYLFCCPSKVPGFVNGIGRWIYATDERSVYINQFIGSSTAVSLPSIGQTVKLRQQTDYPWNGRATYTIGLDRPAVFTVALRLPTWARGERPFGSGLYDVAEKQSPADWSITVNGGPVEGVEVGHDGYVRLQRNWQPGDRIDWTLQMPVRRIHADARVSADRGRVALMRGPLVYCLEGVDNDFDVLKAAVPPSAEIHAEHRPDLLHGVTVLTGVAQAQGQPRPFVAVPYFAWQNRGIAPMATWLVEDPAQATDEPPRNNGPVDRRG